jgi:hypothetical protein
MSDDLHFDEVRDPALRAKLEEAYAKHLGRKPQVIPPEADQYPRYVFARITSDRRIGTPVRIRNLLDEEQRGGTIVRRLGRAFLVDLGDMTVIVHEPDDSWVPYVEAK